MEKTLNKKKKNQKKKKKNQKKRNNQQQQEQILSANKICMNMRALLLTTNIHK